MSRFPGKRLPPHWVYIPSWREVRKMVGDLATDVRLEFGGTGRREDWVSRSLDQLFLGYLERRVVDKAWRFYLQLRGIREAALEGHRDELAEAAVHAIASSVHECQARQADDVVAPTQLHLCFKITAHGVVPLCKIEPVGPYSYSAGRWWADPSRQ
jgi:hypothetical protein